METNIERRETILKLRSEGLSYGEIAKKINCCKSLVSFYCNEHRYDPLKQQEKEESQNEYEQIICKIIRESDNINQICKKLGKRPTNTNYHKIKTIIEKYNVDTSHFCIDYTKIPEKRKYSLEEIFCENSKMTTTSKLRLLLLKNKLKEYRCECCGETEWMGNPIPLQTHHINGDNTDNRIENLQLLCPNCHAITDTYCGRNKSKQEKLQVKGVKTKMLKRICPICGKIMYGKGNKFCSDECYKDWQKQNYTINQLGINKEKLIEAFKEKKNFTQVGLIFNVSDKTISKWCKKFDLPSKSNEMKEYISKLFDK